MRSSGCSKHSFASFCVVGAHRNVFNCVWDRGHLQMQLEDPINDVDVIFGIFFP